MKWQTDVKSKYDQMIEKVPIFMRPVAEKKVGEKLSGILTAAGRDEVTEKDMVDAFFEATPFGFHGPMKTDMEELGIDYKGYGHD